MKRLLTIFALGCATAFSCVAQTGAQIEGGDMKIKVSDGTREIVFELNDSEQSKALYGQLPLRTDVSDYSTNEKIFYLGRDKRLPRANGIEGAGGAGTLAYFSPWGNVVMFYGDFSAYPGLFILGKATSGGERIKDLRGAISVTKVE